MGNTREVQDDDMIYYRKSLSSDCESPGEPKSWEAVCVVEGDRTLYPTIHIKEEELSDDEYIDVVNYFEPDFQTANAGVGSQDNENQENDKLLEPNKENNEIREDIRKPDEENCETRKLIDETGTETRRNDASNSDQRYSVLRQQLATEPLAKQMVMSRNLNNQIEKQLSQSSAKLIKQKYLAKQQGDLASGQVAHDGVLLTSECCHVSAEDHQFVIHKELSGCREAIRSFSAEDLALRYRVLVFLWILLGEIRLFQVGYPTEPVHVVLWRVVHICCSVAGVKSAAAVPLPGHHECGPDMLCFRDHVHRFLEICAPTRDHWKQFGWASLTVDAVVAKIYKQELLPTLAQHSISIPVPIKMAMCRLDSLDRLALDACAPDGRPTSRWRGPAPASPGFRPVAPRPVGGEKKKRGRPVKLHRTAPDTAGKIERVMLWRFVLNLLEEPGNAACIHWLNRDEGIFRILNTDWLARIWGRRHGNPRMTYEKMARAMRTYYRSKVLQPVPRNRNLPRKLVYRFNPALVKKVTAK